MERGLFLPGWAAPSSFYRRGLPERWEALDPPGFRATGGALPRYVEWLVDVLDACPTPVALGGHSMGAALAIIAAAERPQRVARLVLVAPAGVPLQKPIRASAWTLARQTASGVYPPAGAARAVAAVVRAPRSALRLARVLHDIDLGGEMEAIRRAGIPAAVVSCRGDTLVTLEHCRRAAALLGGDCRVVDLPDGHVWMLRGWRQLREQLV